MPQKKAKKASVKIAKGVKIPREKKAELQKKPGGSNVGKYKTVKKNAFCGPAGGSPSGSYPVNNKKRAKAALAYAQNAPNPAGIRECVRKKFPSLNKKRKK